MVSLSILLIGLLISTLCAVITLMFGANRPEQLSRISYIMLIMFGAISILMLGSLDTLIILSECSTYIPEPTASHPQAWQHIIPAINAAVDTAWRISLLVLGNLFFGIIHIGAITVGSMNVRN